MFLQSDFDELIEEHGVPILLRRSRMCPCVGESGQPEIDCSFCRVLPGIIWDDGSLTKVLCPGNQGSTVSGGSRNTRDERYTDPGMSVIGDTIVTFKTGTIVSHGDRIDLLNSEISINNERHTRGALRGYNQISAEVVRITPVLNVEYCEAKIDGELVRYINGTDFSVNAQTGKITWEEDTIPDGTVYTMRYTTNMSYICWSPTAREEGGTKMPYRCLVHRLDFISSPLVES